MKFIKEKEWIKSRLSEEKYLHSLGAEETARELAVELSADVDKAVLAALLHDNAKDIPYEEALQIIKENNFNIDESVKYNTKIVHAYLGACLAQKELGINDEEILNAIRFHTTGRPDMSVLEKIVFLADKIEANTRDLNFRDKVLNIFLGNRQHKQSHIILRRKYD